MRGFKIHLVCRYLQPYCARRIVSAAVLRAGCRGFTFGSVADSVAADRRNYTIAILAFTQSITDAGT